MCCNQMSYDPIKQGLEVKSLSPCLPETLAGLVRPILSLTLFCVLDVTHMIASLFRRILKVNVISWYAHVLTVRTL